MNYFPHNLIKYHVLASNRLLCVLVLDVDKDRNKIVK